MSISVTKETAFVIAHYDKQGHLSKHVLDHVKYISKLTKKIIFVSTHLQDKWLLELTPHAKVIVRPNYGYDFWSYKLGLDALVDLGEVDHIIFWNTSFVCVNPEKLYVSYMDNISQSGMYGITSCNMPSPHIQSYFFSFYGQDLIKSVVFRDWWSRMTPISEREEVIHRYEVGMSKYFLRKDVRLSHAFDLNFFDGLLIFIKILMSLNFKRSLLKRLIKKTSFPRLSSLNLTHYAWSRLLNKFGVIKVELLVLNPTKQNTSRLPHNLNQKEMAHVNEVLANQ